MKPAKRRWATVSYNRKIRNALLTYYLTPILLLLLSSTGFFYLSARASLDEEMGKRLMSISNAAASQVRGFHVSALQLRDPGSQTSQTLLTRFERIRKENHVARIYLFTPRHESLLDTDKTIRPGEIYERNRLHAAELDQVRAGKAAASFLFRGKDGAFYKSAFAPVREGNEVVAIAAVDGSVTFFQNLHRLGRQLAYFAVACTALIIFVTVIISRKIVTPIQSLVAAAQRIGEGKIQTPVDIHSKNEIGFLGFVLDEMRKNILNRDRELQMMLRGIAHEVRNPLGGIELFAGMLEEVLMDPQKREWIEKIQREVKHLQALVEEFLDFARGPALQITSVPLKPFLQELRFAFQKEMEARSISFQLDQIEVESAEFDPDQMRRALLNVVRNSIQAMPNGGRMDLSCKLSNNQLEISVHDTGVGIAEDDVEKVFDPFFTLKDTGTGLGLSFVRKIVNAHGGEVRFESAAGKGTTVTLALPIEYFHVATSHH